MADGVASWWWCGELTVEAQAVTWPAFFESFPKNASPDAVLRVSISDGHTAWQVCRTAPQILVRVSSSRQTGISALRSVLDGAMPGRCVVRPGTGDAGPCVCIWFGDSLGAEVQFAGRAEDCIHMTSFSTLLLSYLADVEARNRDEQNGLAAAIQDRDRMIGICRAKVIARNQVNADMADRMRRLIVAKRKRFSSSASGSKK
jgi:hypothetical protein